VCARQAWEDGIKLRKNHRPATLADFRSWQKALPDSFLDQNVVDINPTVIRETLEELTDGETRPKSGLRYISAILGDCVKAGTLAENPTTSETGRRSSTTSFRRVPARWISPCRQGPERGSSIDSW